MHAEHRAEMDCQPDILETVASLLRAKAPCRPADDEGFEGGRLETCCVVRTLAEFSGPVTSASGMLRCTHLRASESSRALHSRFATLPLNHPRDWASGGNKSSCPAPAAILHQHPHSHVMPLSSPILAAFLSLIPSPDGRDLGLH